MIIEPVNTTQTAEVVPFGGAKSEPGKQREAPGASGGNKEDVRLLKEVLEVARNHFQILDVGLDFSVHGGTGRIKVSVTDKQTGDVIREIPPEGVLNLMAKLEEMMGILFDQKA
jgi:flagellar protein FlaG